jgi:hypothetical protein
MSVSMVLGTGHPVRVPQRCTLLMTTVVLCCSWRARRHVYAVGLVCCNKFYMIYKRLGVQRNLVQTASHSLDTAKIHNSVALAPRSTSKEVMYRMLHGWASFDFWLRQQQDNNRRNLIVLLVLPASHCQKASKVMVDVPKGTDRSRLFRLQSV